MSCHFCSLVTKFFIAYFERFLKRYIRKNNSFEHDFVLKCKLKLDVINASSLKKAKLMFFWQKLKEFGDFWQNYTLCIIYLIYKKILFVNFRFENI